MKLTALKEHLQKAINASQRMIVKNPALPILENILVKGENKRIQISSTNLEIGLHFGVKGKVEREGKASIPVGALAHIINAIQEERVTLEAKRYDVEVSTQTFHASINGQDCNDFPIIPSLNEELFFDIKGELLQRALAQLENIVTVSQTYPEISGVFWHLGDKGIDLVATDSFRLGKKELPIELAQTLQGAKFILPLRSAQELLRILQDSQPAAVRISFNQNQVLFIFEEIYFISRLLAGTYPNYADLIPHEFALDVFLAREEAINTIKLVGVFSPKTSDVKIEILGNTIQLSAQNQQGSCQATVKSKVHGSGISEAIFNYRYLLDGLSNIKQKEVMISFKDGSSPVLFRGVGDQSYIYVLMPLKP